MYDVHTSIYFYFRKFFLNFEQAKFLLFSPQCLQSSTVQYMLTVLYSTVGK